VFYLESERFRMSLLAGCVPVKALLHPAPGVPLLPFHYLLPAAECLADFLRSLDLPATWARFEDEFLALPPLEEGVAEALTGLGIAVNGARANGVGLGHAAAARSRGRVVNR
jgi:hypothetical protein